VRTLSAALMLCAAPIAVPATEAIAQECPAVEIVFARGTTEAPGIGRVGQAFVDAVRSRIGDRSLGVYAVNYPASFDFLAAAGGANDASAHIQQTAINCPATRMVLGGFSQGAAVIDVITSVPIPVIGFTDPMPDYVPNHVAAIAVFGNPAAKAGIPLTASLLYGARAIDLCNTGDPVCSDGNDITAHSAYPEAGLTGRAADFVARLL
jgi:cutinase